MALDDVAERLADKPRNERGEPIGGRVLRMTVGTRWEQARIVQKIARRPGNRFDPAGGA